ncbi:MAG: mevalonate kinase, partial [Promethearchaeia archaeon]
MLKVIAPGKCILFGEHSVVYGYPAIAMALGINSTCKIKRISHNQLRLHLKDYDRTFNFSSIREIRSKFPQEFKNFQVGFLSVIDRYGIDVLGMEVQISSDLFMGGGLGSSASTAVALMGGLGSFFDLDLDKAQISDLAYNMEKIVHGNPSGIDNTICTNGNILIYQNKQFQTLENIPHSNFLITYTNMDHSTKVAVEKVANLKQQRPEYVNKIFRTIGKVTDKAEKVLKRGNIAKLGDLMNKNQELLTKLGVSNRQIKKINKISLKNGLYGSKLTGAGLGGCVIGI